MFQHMRSSKVGTFNHIQKISLALIRNELDMLKNISLQNLPNIKDCLMNVLMQDMIHYIFQNSQVMLKDLLILLLNSNQSSKILDNFSFQLKKRNNLYINN